MNKFKIVVLQQGYSCLRTRAQGQLPLHALPSTICDKAPLRPAPYVTYTHRAASSRLSLGFLVHLQ